MTRERHKSKDEADIIDALHRGGQPRSSFDATVMVAEPRWLADELKREVN